MINYSSKTLKYLDEIQRKIEYIRKNYSGKSQLLIAFRGESCQYNTALMPSLFRNEKFSEKEKHMFELIEDYGLGKGTLNSNLERLMEAQHYMAISRLLDISFNALVALYFACSNDDNENKDGVVFIFGFPEHYSPHSKYLEEFYTNVLEGRKNLAYARNFKVITHSYSNDRVKAQHGGFILFPGEEFYPINPIYYKSIKIHAADKPDIIKELDLMFQIKRETLFPGIESISEIIKEKFTGAEYVERVATIQDEIDMFFKRIEYEYMTMKRIGSWSPTDLKRQLRKEETDITYFIRRQLGEVSQEERTILIERVNKKFRMMQKFI